MPETNKQTNSSKPMNNAVSNSPSSQNNQSWYQKWHSTNHHSVTHWIIFGVIVVAFFLLLSAQIKDWVASLNQPVVTVALSRPDAELALSPQTETVTVGDTFSTDIVLNTGTKPVDGVDIYSLHYDPTILQVIDDQPKVSGVQIEPGTIMNGAANIVDDKSGTIKYGAASAGGTSFTGTGLIATVHFKAIAAGTAYLKFDFTLGSTTDSNAAYRGKDQLTKVVDAIYTVNPK